MKKIAALVLASGLAGTCAHAQLLAYDPFADASGSGGTSYTVGSNLIGQTNAQGLTWFQAGPTGTQPTIASGNLTVSGLAPSTGNSVTYGAASGESARLALGVTNTSGTFYYSLAMKLNALPGNGAAGAIVSAFNNSGGSQTGQPSVLGTAIRVTTNALGSYIVGVDKSGSGAATTAFDTTDTFSAGQTLFIVGSYSFITGTANDSSSLWINPNSSTFGLGSAPTATLTITNGADMSALASLILREANTILPGITVDEVRVGDTWADVTPTVVSAPEPGTIALLGLGGAGLLIARRKRSKA